MSPTAVSRLVASALGVLALAACGGSAPTAKLATTETQRAVTEVVGPCVPAAVHHGAPPAWTAAAWSDSPGFRAPYALASGDAAAAFFFVPKLRAGHPSNPANKILWVVRFPRNGNPLVITARLGRDPAKVVRISRPADSSPGEIYPSYVDLPTTGCWRLQLAWGPHRANIDVRVVPRAAKLRS